MPSPVHRRRSYEDELGRVKRVDRSALGVVAKHGDRVGREVYVLDRKRPPERIGKRRKYRA
jgi:hypothetical protein